MKRFGHLGLLMSSLAFMTISCEKEKLVDDPKIEVIESEIQGKWLWLHSIGGFGGNTLTPESEGYSKFLFIDSDTYTEFKNDSIIYHGLYIFREDSLYGFPGSLSFPDDPGNLFLVEITENYMRLVEPCFDCYQHYYTKE